MIDSGAKPSQVVNAFLPTKLSIFPKGVQKTLPTQ